MDPRRQATRVIMFLHGGGYISGSIASHRPMIAQAEREAQARRHVWVAEVGESSRVVAAGRRRSNFATENTRTADAAPVTLSPLLKDNPRLDQ
jgi:hypothetical protein